MMLPVILAAGRGSRLGAAARGRPKCLARIGRTSLLDWQRRALAAAGCASPIVVGGYSNEYLRAVSGERLIVNPHWSECGPIGSLLCVPAAQLAHGFLLVYGDIAFHPDLPRALCASSAPLAITVDLQWHALWSMRFAEVLEDAETLRWDGARTEIIAIGGRASAVEHIEGQFTGLLKVSAEGWRSIRQLLDTMPADAARRLDATTLLGALLACGVPIGGVPIHGRWIEVDSAEDLRRYRHRLRSRERWSHDWRWERI